MESLKNVDLDLKDLMGVVIEHLSDSDTSSDEDRDESESEEECEKNKEDFLSPSRKAISPRSASRRPRGKRPQATQKDESMARKFPSLGVTFQADVLPFSIKYANANANANGDEDGSHGDSKCVWSVLSGPPPFDELSIPCYWSQSPTQNPPQSPSMPVCGIQTPSKALRSVSDDELSALESLVDRTLHAAMLAQYLPGMVVTYIKGVEGEGKTGGGEAGSLSLMKSKEEKQKEKEKDRDRDRGDDYLHASRSSKRISIVSGVGVKSARFGCIVKGPFYRDVTRTTTSTSASDSSRLSTAVDVEPEMSSSSSTGKAMRSGEGLLVSPCMRQPMMVLHTGVTDEVRCLSQSLCFVVLLSLHHFTSDYPVFCTTYFYLFFLHVHQS